ncbi:MAG TPA: methylmalonyl Co-A mutase-associated GTPase MeaB [Cytophagaceae bacterium]|nr:methylmalonyl Co-A mutase-associated GTPase MeaB [Cytophagaceae bacterium]
MAEKRLTSEKYKTGILSRDFVLLGRAITLIESNLPKDEKRAAALIESILPFTGNSFRIGISGIPGVGKSTFIEVLGNQLIHLGKRVAVLAIDPSSKINGGSILGDKTRMNELAKNEMAFVRPTPSSHTMGGVASKTYETILLCEAAGFDYIIIETVGVGQSETEVYDLSDFFLLLMISGMGDELQTMKKGIMELADAIVLNKADGSNIENAKKNASEIKQMLHYLSSSRINKNEPIVTICSAKENRGIDEIVSLLEKFKEKAKKNGHWEKRRADSILQNFSKTLNRRLLYDFYSQPNVKKSIRKVKKDISKGMMTPQAGAILLLKQYRKR